MALLTEDEARAKIAKAYERIVKAATNWVPTDKKQMKTQKPYPARRFKFTGTYAEVNALFQKRKWSMTLPIIPPTEEKVAAMLKGTKRNPADVVWVVPPRNGMLTVELVATLGVMAGAKPEHMPLLLAAVEAMSDPWASWRGTTTTTAATVPFFVIGGPIVKKLGLNAGLGTASSGNPAQNALGYFVNLVGDVVGGSVPPDFDKTTQGSTGDLVATVFCENDEGNPWTTSFREDQGFKKNDSTITYFGAYLPSAYINNNCRTGQTMLNTIATGILGPAGIGSCLADSDVSQGYTTGNKCRFVVLMLAPAHARVIAKDFPNKDDARKYLVDTAAMPYKFYSHETCLPPKDFGPYDDNTMIRRFKTPSSIHIVVSGPTESGNQSQMWPPFASNLKPVVKLIKE